MDSKLSEYGGKDIKSEHKHRNRSGTEYDARDYQKERLPEYAQVKAEYGGGREILDYPVDPRKHERFIKESR